MKRSPLTLAIALVLLLVFGPLPFVYQVRKSEVAVVTFFGRVDHVKTEPGAGFRLPWPIEKVYKLDQRIQNFEGKFDPMTLPDQNILMLLTYVGWQIEDPAVFFPKFQEGSISEAESALEGYVRSAKTEVAGQHPFSDFISADATQTKFAQIEKEIADKVQTQVHQYGIAIKFVQIKKIGLPESVTQDVFNRMTSERQVHISKIQAEGEEESVKLKSAADRDANKLLTDADAQALKIRGDGEAAMMKSLEILQQNPRLATFNLKIDGIEQMLKEKATLILDQSTPPLDLLMPPKENATAPAQK
jgi:membrane protease subunit HflC